MTEGQVQGKCVLVRNNGEFEITECKLAGSNCSNCVVLASCEDALLARHAFFGEERVTRKTSGSA